MLSTRRSGVLIVSNIQLEWNLNLQEEVELEGKLHRRRANWPDFKLGKQNIGNWPVLDHWQAGLDDSY